MGGGPFAEELESQLQEEPLNTPASQEAMLLEEARAPLLTNIDRLKSRAQELEQQLQETAREVRWGSQGVLHSLVGGAPPSRRVRPPGLPRDTLLLPAGGDGVGPPAGGARGGADPAAAGAEVDAAAAGAAVWAGKLRPSRPRQGNGRRCLSWASCPALAGLVLSWWGSHRKRGQLPPPPKHVWEVPCWGGPGCRPLPLLCLPVGLPHRGPEPGTLASLWCSSGGGGCFLLSQGGGARGPALEPEIFRVRLPLLQAWRGLSWALVRLSTSGS